MLTDATQLNVVMNVKKCAVSILCSLVKLKQHDQQKFPGNELKSFTDIVCWDNGYY